MSPSQRAVSSAHSIPRSRSLTEFPRLYPMPSKKQNIEIEGREVTISNVEKVFYPESGYTKGEVIRFYSQIADVILPHLHNRPPADLETLSRWDFG